MAAKTVKVDFPAEIFDVEVNVPLIHQVVVAQQAAARQGTHSTKRRGEVRGGGRKPYKQKGTGRARQGSTRAPQFAGGGVVHGPKPRDYDQRTPKKMKAAALRGALSDRARNDRIHVVDGLVSGDKPSTKLALAALAALSDRVRFLVVLERTDALTWLSLRNAQQVHIVAVDQLNTYDVLAVRRRGLHPGRLRRLRERHRRRQRSAERDRGGRQVSTLHKDHRDILIAPVVSEKSYGLLDANKYTFIVRPDANKTEIKIAVEKVFNVKVTSVNTINRQGKTRRTRTGLGKRANTKRAIVSLAEGHRIDIFGRSGLLTGLRNRTDHTWLSASTSRPPRAVVAPRWPTSSRSPGPRRRSR